MDGFIWDDVKLVVLIRMQGCMRRSKSSSSTLLFLTQEVIQKKITKQLKRPRPHTSSKFHRMVRYDTNRRSSKKDAN
jgi:hypothetical protein